MSWDFFRRRVDITAAELVAANGCATYVELVKILNGRGVAAPPESEVAALFEEQAKPVQPAVSKPPAPKKRITTRKSKSTKKKVEAVAKGSKADSENAVKSDS